MRQEAAAGPKCGVSNFCSCRRACSTKPELGKVSRDFRISCLVVFLSWTTDSLRKNSETSGRIRF